MDTSILYSIKMYLGIDPVNCAFDAQIIVYINMALDILRQLGVSEDYDQAITSVVGIEETWFDFIGPQEPFLEMVKAFVGMKTKLFFDPPGNSFTVSAMEKACEELTWRILIEVEERRRKSGRLYGYALWRERNEMGCSKTISNEF